MTGIYRTESSNKEIKKVFQVGLRRRKIKEQIKIKMTKYERNNTATAKIGIQKIH